MDIELIGSVGGQDFYTAEQIAGFIKKDHTELNYGSQFMGRPGTRLYSGDTDILKLRSELKLNGAKIKEWARRALEQERKLGVHHPKKCWFIVQTEPGEFTAGNICPRMNPLHAMFAQSDACDDRQKIELLKALYHAYFRIAGEFSRRLDEGLSNFGVDNQNRLYYLDDDVYSWDNFLTFSHILGVLIRNNSWLNESLAEALGGILYELVEDFFPGSEARGMIAGKLRDIFMPDINRQHVFEVIIKKFQNDKIVSKKFNFKDRYVAIFADVHANLPALEAVLGYLRQENIKQGIVLGDTVGYGPHPAQCIDRLQDSGYNVIKGNHDHAAVSGENCRGMSSTAKWCIQWTIPHLSPAHKQWLEDLPMELSGELIDSWRWLAVHGAPVDPHFFYGYVYEMTFENNLDALQQRAINICFHGHAHVQGIYARKKGAPDSFYKERQQHLQPYKQSLICPGSVGQPRDGATGAQLAILDQQNKIITFKTINYELSETIEAMKAFAFPETLLSRLEKGY